ncbi:HAMP domain-containing histidine kinase [Paenibacillus athensensis]|uniref:histidine kinase n=1 Tax=Paenibacillus athensensis TaxID=1967502 RepID=A0A4Y8Q172_9BACL|nr:HAMP domain-containing sensor histidine kinase [Paenibacillus athensensis]MCD1260646.1 HAMP domain-containing histidine kinase [Paenibacillus athensensis]
MLFVLFALWLIALLLLLVDPRAATMRWMSAVAFCGGIGALAALLDASIIPYVHRQASNPRLEQLLYHVQSVSSVCSYYGLPYSFARLALHYNPAWPGARARKLLPYVLLLPPVACLAFTPWYTADMPITFAAVAPWAVPYILGGAVLIAARRERLRSMQRTHLYTCLALLPPVVGFSILNYMMPLFGFYRMWVYNTWVLAVIVPFFVFIFFKYGFLDIRLLIERRKLDSTLRAITSGTAILNHAIKNDVGKIRLFSEKMKLYAEETAQPELLEDLQVLIDASEHIRDMITRVHEQTQDVPMRQTPADLRELVQSVVASLKPGLAGITLRLGIPQELVLRLDRAQISETLSNVLINAAEAMPAGGDITVRAFTAKRSIVLEVKDSGIGMDKAVLARVLEPFYTTKSGSRHNFGLGLAYCYNVMKSHGGSLELKSEPGQGTTVFLIFPGTLAFTSLPTAEE